MGLTPIRPGENEVGFDPNRVAAKRSAFWMSFCLRRTSASPSSRSTVLMVSLPLLPRGHQS